MNINNSNMTNNTHFVQRFRNMRNELLASLDHLMLADNYERLTEQQKN